MSRRGERNGGKTWLGLPTWLVVVAGTGLAGSGFVGVLCAGLLLYAVIQAENTPTIGSTVVVVADPSSTYTAGATVLVTDRLLTYEQLGKSLRTRDRAGVERMTKEGDVLTLSPGDRLLIVNELGLSDTYVARVLTGPLAGKQVFINPPNVKLAD